MSAVLPQAERDVRCDVLIRDLICGLEIWASLAGGLRVEKWRGITDSVHWCTAPPGVMEGGEGSNMVATIFVSQKSNLA